MTSRTSEWDKSNTSDRRSRRARSEKPRETARALPIALLRAREAVMSRFRPLVAHAGLTDPQWRVLRVLNEHGPLDPTQIAQKACILLPSLSRMLRILEDDELIVRSGAPNDKRSSIIAVTPKARQLLLKMVPMSNTIYEELERTYGKARMRELLDLLEELAELPDPS